MQIKSDYLIASFISFLIHALIILYLMDFFYSEKKVRPILSNPINVNLLYKEDNKAISKIEIIEEKPSINSINTIENIISFSPKIESTNISKLIREDQLIKSSSEDHQVNQFSNMMIQLIQSAWIKPQNIQDGLVCNLRMVINKNGRIVAVDLIKSSGNIRFDNSAIKAISRVETFSFFNEIPFNLYQKNFKNIVITFNPL
ncbi:MAG: cell envelope integrity protein TolA [Gammaproteobacteria bacterium]|uniref:LytB protein n=1 Tax=SAR86 cluster bacterium TaxID=2030880 RepID=A0A520MG08_9GAMM|nr:MAG: LytB protein [SAR86 cluster bacterium]|tara:strand:- start:1088 stop:1690 length:603 start_codon:yes stop_codon:yes gene_type:complete